MSFATSRKIPEEVFRTGEARIVADLLDGELASMHMHTVALGVRNVLCVPLRLVRYVDKAEAVGEERRIGVLYLDSKEKGSLLSSSTRAALETLATEAAVAIENARLYRETMEKARMEQEMRIAAEIQQALLPKSGRVGSYFRAAAASLPCRSIGGDFYDYVDMPAASLGFALGDVAGKGPPAALLSAMMQGIFAAQAASSDGPSQTIARVNLALYRRGIESRFVTLMYGVLDARRQLIYCNAGHNPPLIISASGSGDVRRLDRGGPDRRPVRGGDLRGRGTCTWRPATGSSCSATACPKRCRPTGRNTATPASSSCVQNHADTRAAAAARSALLGRARIRPGAAQSDDITAMVLRFGTLNAQARPRGTDRRRRLDRPRRRGLERRLRSADDPRDQGLPASQRAPRSRSRSRRSR